jgi:hypothetical protein
LWVYIEEVKEKTRGARIEIPPHSFSSAEQKTYSVCKNCLEEKEVRNKSREDERFFSLKKATKLVIKSA